MIEIKTKMCSKCKVEKDISNFNKNKSKKDGLSTECKNCIKQYKKDHYEENKSKILKQRKQYREENLSKIKEQRKENYKNNKNEIKEQRKENYKKNKKEILEQCKEYREIHKEEIKKYREEHKEERKVYSRIYAKNRKQNDLSFKLRQIVSNSIRNELKVNNSAKKGKSCIKYLEYTIEELKEHIENQFESWMTWENWGLYIKKNWDDNDQFTWKWQLDHIIPQSDLPYISMEDPNFQICWALENLRPLSAKQNILDGISRVRHKSSNNVIEIVN